MPRRKRQTNTFNLSFLDVMSCGFGAVILVFLIIDHSIEIQIQSVNAEVLSEVNLLEEDIRDGEEGLVRLRNAVSSVDLDIVEATGRARVVTEELGRLEALVASLEESDVSETTDLDALKAEINVLEEQIQQLREAAEADGGRSAREFQGEGNRQYLTGLKLGGNRIAILIDVSASMLAPEVVNVIRMRNQSPTVQRGSKKWVQALDTVDWLTAQLPTGARYQLILFNTQARFALPETQGRWLEIADSEQVERAVSSVRNVLPEGGTSLHTAFNFLSELDSKPDNIFLVTDGLPTQGKSTPRKNTVSGPARLKHYRDALKALPSGVPVNVVLSPMEGDPLAASEFWKLAQNTGGSFMAPAKDWP
jgi:hypothetical protein